ncbi:MAG: transposase [Gemmataceae bacterium]|nr:transposase [Gemmataceae bacterium]
MFLEDEEYERHLPHIVPVGKPIFLTWCLKGAVTKPMKEKVALERERLLKTPRRLGESEAAQRVRFAKLLFDYGDRLLGETKEGPMHLSDPDAAQVVVDSLFFGAGERYDLFAFVVMGNHVHVLLTPRWPLSKVTKGIKGFTSWRINEMQRSHGRVFWQDESYDHWVRDGDGLPGIIEYIERNPVAAGLCDAPEEWPWSSARLRSEWPKGEPWRPGTSK